MEPFKLYHNDTPPSPLRQTWTEFKQNHISLVGFWFIIGMLLMCILVPWFLPYSATEQNPSQLLLPPSWEPNGSVMHLLGTDSLGRDLFTRILYGCRTTFFAGFVIVVLSLSIGTLLGTIAGMYKGIKASSLNHLLDIFMALPTLLIAIIIVAIFGPGIVNLIIAITLAMIPKFVHSARSAVRIELDKEYVMAARLDGANDLHLLLHSILPNMFQLIIVQTTLAFTTVLLDVTALGFLNLGAQPPYIELGALIGDGLNLRFIAPWNSLMPGFFIIAMIISINLVGDGLRTALDRR